jgi:hypothetical protein
MITLVWGQPWTLQVVNRSSGSHTLKVLRPMLTRVAGGPCRRGWQIGAPILRAMSSYYYLHSYRHIISAATTLHCAVAVDEVPVVEAKFAVVNFYVINVINDVEQEVKHHQEILTRLGMVGRVYVCREGINAQVGKADEQTSIALCLLSIHSFFLNLAPICIAVPRHRHCGITLCFFSHNFFVAILCQSQISGTVANCNLYKQHVNDRFSSIQIIFKEDPVIEPAFPSLKVFTKHIPHGNIHITKFYFHFYFR